jgi:Transposase and inactivated derivatives
MSMVDKQEREQRRRAQRAGVEALEASGALDEIYALIDAGKLKLDGDDGFIQHLIRAGLERGLQAELTEHVGYEIGDSEAELYPNSRNGSFPKTVGTSVGDVELSIPRGTAMARSPRCWCPKGPGVWGSWTR